MTEQSQPKVDGRGFVTVDGVKIGRIVRGPDGQPRLQCYDKNKHRAFRRGSCYVEVSINQLSDIAKDSTPIDKSE